MESLGEYLRQVRQKKGLEVDQIAEKTRINAVYIRALEAERFEQFPGETFAKGFVRSYARSLGLDEQKILKRFKESSSGFYSKTNEKEREIAVQAEREIRKKTLFNRVFQGAILLLIGTSVWFVYGLNSARVTTLPPPDGPTGADEPEDFLGLSPEETGFEIPFDSLLLQESEGQYSQYPGNTGSEPRPPQSGLPGAGTGGIIRPVPAEEMSSSVNIPGVSPFPLEISNPLILRIEAVEDSWILARIDDMETKEVFLRVGEKVTWEASEKFLVDFGNAGGVIVSLDGKPLPRLGESGQVVKKVLYTRE